MKQAIAELLRKRTTWQLVAIAAVCTSVALLVIYNSYSSTRKLLSPLLTALFGVAGAALVLAVVRCSEDIERGAPARRSWLRLVGAVVVTGGSIAYTTYSFGHFNTQMMAGCNAAIFLPETLAERRAALAEAEARLRHPFAWLPGLVDDRAARECQRTREDLDRVDLGLCTRWTLPGHACTCGPEQYPYERCAEPNCLYAPGMPDKFDCVGDVIPDEYIGY